MPAENAQPTYLISVLVIFLFNLDAIANGNEVPLIKTNHGITKSATVKPFQGAC